VPAQFLLPPASPEQILGISQTSGKAAAAARDQMVDLFGNTLKKLTARTCRRYCLKDQDRDDVLSETYQQVFNPEIARFATGRGKPGKYFRGLVQNAARKVMSQRDTRRRSSASDAGSMTCGKGRSRRSSHRKPSAIPSPAEEAEQRDTVAFVLREAPPRLRRALELCYWDEWPLTRIAKQLGLSRFALSRAIKAFFEDIHGRLNGN
jgi:RNA polymerase sigma factor (sigma-70 family)